MKRILLAAALALAIVFFPVGDRANAQLGTVNNPQGGGGGVSEATWSTGMTNIVSTTGNCTSSPGAANQCIATILPSAHTLIRLTFILGTSPAGCTTQPTYGLQDITSNTAVNTISIANGAATGFTDSGALSVAMTAGHEFGLGVITISAGCTTQAQVYGITAVFK